MDPKNRSEKLGEREAQEGRKPVYRHINELSPMETLEGDK